MPKAKTPTPRKLLAEANRLLQNQQMPRRFFKAETVAILSGPAIVIEAIVMDASKDSGIPMDWCYQGGRAFVQAIGDKKKARSALYCAIPNSNLSISDL
jgi:hypothetical protein